jgi:hypothetical protein
VGDADHIHSVGSVDYQQAAVDEYLHSGPGPLWQGAHLYLTAGPAVGVVDCDEAYEPGEHVVLVESGGRNGGRERGVGMAGERALHPAEGGIPRERHRVAAA